MDELQALTANWKRSILVDSSIDDELVRRLAPRIFELRQESDDPITVGIDSPGGSIASLDTLLGLLVGANQDFESGRIITVVTNRSYSAAANLLALGSYAVAFQHARIIYHDVRYGGMEVSLTRFRGRFNYAA